MEKQRKGKTMIRKNIWKEKATERKRKLKDNNVI